MDTAQSLPRLPNDQPLHSDIHNHVFETPSRNCKFEALLTARLIYLVCSLMWSGKSGLFLVVADFARASARKLLEISPISSSRRLAANLTTPVANAQDWLWKEQQKACFFALIVSKYLVGHLMASIWAKAL